MAALLLKAIEADVSGPSQIFAPWKCPQTGQYTSSHVLESRQKLMGSVSTPVETGRPVIGHSNKIVPISFSCSMKSRDGDAGMVNEWLRRSPAGNDWRSTDGLRRVKLFDDNVGALRKLHGESS